ncbi:hypothetical protein C8R43DRAFT_1042439 [Mycena crocata]|nr:hypothetical protein C8R43DRAFT_1042439 [Mycena crocata]
MASRHNTQDLCINCHSAAKQWNPASNCFYPYCSKACASSSTPVLSNACVQCRVMPKNGNHPYCGKSCAQAAKRAGLPLLTPVTQFRSQSSPSSGWSPSASRRGNAMTPDSPQRSMQARRQVLFYERSQPYYGFTNFSAHPVMYEGKQYPTSEHLFQAFKFMDNHPDIAEEIRTISYHPRDAYKLARVHKADQHPDWSKTNIAKMDIAVWHKFTQHEALKQELLGTGDAELIEVRGFSN